MDFFISFNLTIVSFESVMVSVWSDVVHLSDNVGSFVVLRSDVDLGSRCGVHDWAVG